MKQGWEYKKLGDICNVINGLWTGKKEPFINVAVIRNTNFSKDCQLNLENVAYIDVEAKQFASRKLLCGDIIIEKSGGSEKQPVGRPILFNISDGDYSFSNFTSTLRIKENAKVDSSFLHKCLYAFYLKGETFKLQSKTTGLHNLNMKGYLRSTIPLPPKSTQLAIVSELDKINELIRLKKEQLKDYDNIAQSIFYEMFGDPVENEKGWEVKKIGDLAIVKTGPFGSMLHKEDYITDGIPLVNPVHMKDFKIVPDKEFTISKEKACDLENYMLQNNDVVFARRGDIGRCAIVSKTEHGYLCGTGSLFVRFTEDIESVFIMYIVRSKSFSKHLVSKAKGATMLNINSNTIADLKILLPPLPLQHLFAQRIEQIEHQKSEVAKAITDLETLLASRMQYWFE